MRIGDAAAALGVATHVLRHWDDVGVVVPHRAPSGQREYTGEQVERLRVVRACQAVGLSLEEIRHILHRGESGRDAVIEQRIRRIRAQRSELDAAETFLVHVKDCRHSLLTRCRECSGYASRPPAAIDPV